MENPMLPADDTQKKHSGTTQKLNRTPREVVYFTGTIAAGIVAVRDAEGNPITELQGSYHDVRDEILAASDEGRGIRGPAGGLTYPQPRSGQASRFLHRLIR
jgi:hypothetical protein